MFQPDSGRSRPWVLFSGALGRGGAEQRDRRIQTDLDGFSDGQKTIDIPLGWSEAGGSLTFQSCQTVVGTDGAGEALEHGVAREGEQGLDLDSE